jgi:hypothetical protein
MFIKTGEGKLNQLLIELEVQIMNVRHLWDQSSPEGKIAWAFSKQKAL